MIRGTRHHSQNQLIEPPTNQACVTWPVHQAPVPRDYTAAPCQGAMSNSTGWLQSFTRSLQREICNWTGFLPGCALSFDERVTYQRALVGPLTFWDPLSPPLWLDTRSRGYGHRPRLQRPVTAPTT